MTLGSLSSGDHGYKRIENVVPIGYTPWIATAAISSVNAVQGTLILSADCGGRDIYVSYYALANITEAQSNVNYFVLCKKN